MKALLTLILGFIPFSVHLTEVPQAPTGLEYNLSKMRKGLDCLIDNMYHEAYAEGVVGRQLVAKVTLNRAGTFENVCRVIYKPKQFSWVHMKQNKHVPTRLRQELQNEALEVYYGFVKLPFKSADHYHTTAVKPVWRTKLKFLGTWKNHHFYTS